MGYLCSFLKHVKPSGAKAAGVRGSWCEGFIIPRDCLSLGDEFWEAGLVQA